MKTRLKQLVCVNESIYKTVLSIITGGLCLFGAFHSIRLTTSLVKIDIVWCLVLPLMIALAWGVKYGMISLSAGLGGFYPFFIWPKLGVLAIVSTASIFLLVAIHGFGAEKRREGSKSKLYGIYFLQLVFSVIYGVLVAVFYLVLLKSNQYPWQTSLYNGMSWNAVGLIEVKTLFNFIELVAVSDILLLAPPVRKILRLGKPYIYVRSLKNALVFIAFGFLSIVVTLAVSHNVFKEQTCLYGLFNPDSGLMTGLIAGTLISCIGANLVAIYDRRRMETEELLKESEEKYRKIFNNISDLYTEADLDGTILVASPSAEILLGYRPDEMIGRNIQEVYCQPEQRTDMVQTVMEKKFINNYEIEMQNRYGNKLYLWLNARVECYGDDKFKIVSMARNVTNYVEMKRKQQESEEKYRLLYESMLNAYVVFEPVYYREHNLVDLRYVDVNPGFERLFKVKASEFVGKTWGQVNGSIKSLLEPYRKVLETGKPIPNQVFHTGMDRYYQGTIFKVREHQVGIIFDDVTEQVKAEAELGKLNDELESKVIERTSELQSAMTEMEAFVYSVSHDLKSPLRAIDGYNRLIQEDYGASLDEGINDRIRHVRNICNEMMEMIGKLLKYSTTSRMELSREAVSIEELFTEVFEELKPPGRQVVFEFETGMPVVFADRILLKQVVANILSNAVKFTRPRERALIVAGCKAGLDELVFHVRDNGVGLDMSQAGKAFEVFQRLHSSRDFEGSGVGLAVVRRIIEKHGGQTWIEGEPEEGVTIYFTIPKA